MRNLIANECPMVGGNSVYKARSMYRMINDTIVFDDQQLCLPYGILVRSMKAQEGSTVAVVPNPARDEATLVLGQPLQEEGSFVVYNAVGEQVMRMAIPADAPRIAFGTNGLATGVYHYRVLSSSGMLGNGKLTIVR